MSSNKVRKYLAYYRKKLNEDPENIEARLRLAALFRDMGRTSHAIEEYGTAAKLLASDGLPLEAIAACKAILELDPSHQDTQLFLAKLYAEVPSATNDTVRVARPVETEQTSRAAKANGAADGGTDGAEEPDSDEFRITLEEPKAARERRRNKTREMAPEDAPMPISVGDDEAATATAAADELAPFSDPSDLAKKHPPIGSDYDDDTDSRSAIRPTDPSEHRRADASSTREITQVQVPNPGSERRRQTREDDRQTFEVDVFEMESLDLEELATGEWENLEVLEGLEEPENGRFGTPRELAAALEGGDASSVEREFRVSALPRIPLFSQLPRKVFVDVLNGMEVDDAEEGDEILSPDDPASCLYVIVKGRVRVEKERPDGTILKLATMGEGQVFGEFRLLTGKGGRARVVAESDVELLAVSDEEIYRIGERHPEMWDVLWSFYYGRMLNHALASSEVFQTLNREERELVADHFELQELTAEEVLFERGEDVNELSLVVSGSVQVEIPDDRGRQVVDVLEEGAFVGLSPCAREVPATATVRARTYVVLYKLHGEVFRELMYGLPEVAQAVREIVEHRQARTPSLPGQPTVSDWV